MSLKEGGMINKLHVNLTMDRTILEWVDALRGQMPRSAFINKLLSKLSKQSKDVFDWDLEEKLADEDIKNGKVKSFSNTKDAIKWLRK